MLFTVYNQSEMQNKGLVLMSTWTKIERLLQSDRHLCYFHDSEAWTSYEAIYLKTVVKSKS